MLFITTFFTKIYYGEIKKSILKIILLSSAFLPIILWKLFCYSKGIAYSHFVNENTLPNLLDRINEASNYLQISYFIFLNEKFLICLAFFLISFLVKRNRELFGFVSISIFLYISILFFIYLSTPYDFYWQLNSTAARVVKSLSFSLAFFGLYNFGNYKINI